MTRTSLQWEAQTILPSSFKLTSSNNHVHIHFWNTADAVWNADATPISEFDSFITCWDDYNFGSTWNRPQFYGTYSGVRASWVMGADEVYGDFQCPVANVVLQSPGTFEANYASLKVAVGGAPCPLVNIPETSGYQIAGLQGGAQCSRRFISDARSSNGKPGKW
jgi:hypothetical protein